MVVVRHAGVPARVDAVPDHRRPVLDPGVRKVLEHRLHVPGDPSRDLQTVLVPFLGQPYGDDADDSRYGWVLGEENVRCEV